jgi:predicted O-methyltransferase YrrM
MDSVIASVLTGLEELNGPGNRFWNVPRTTGVFLNAMVRSANAVRVLEIGTSNGYSAIWLAEALSHTGGCLYTVESHKERFAMAGENIKRAGLEKCVSQVFGHAPEILSSIPGPFDFIFLDATKMEYQSYAEALVPMIRDGGVVVADNCLSHAAEVRNFVAYVKEHRGQDGVESFRTVLLPLDNGLFLALKA